MCLLDASARASEPDPARTHSGKSAAWTDTPVKETPKEEAPNPADRATVAFAVASLFGAAIAFRRLAPKIGVYLNDRFNPLIKAAVSGRFSLLLVEDPNVAEFFNALRTGSNTPQPSLAVEAPGSLNRLHVPGGEAGVTANPLQEFFDAAPRRLGRLRAGLAAATREADETVRQKELAELCSQVGRLREKCSVRSELAAVWQMASALQGLLKQLSSKAANATPSAMRTAAGAVDLLEALCVPGVKPTIISEPAIRLLAVDDDAVSRHAISFALKKAFKEPDLAPDGKAALTLARRQSYDAIFLDVEMPGMDGFELCSKIRETALNGNTPVVFVTRHSDFNSRTKSVLKGGQDLIAKPFLSFEITVKALSLVLRARLDNGSGSAPAKKTGPRAVLGSQQPPMRKDTQIESTLPVHSDTLRAEDGSRSGQSGGDNSPHSPKPTPQNSAGAALAQSPAQFGELRNRLHAAIQTPPSDLGQFLGDLYVGVHKLNEEAERAERRAAHRLGCALEGMLKKLLEKPKLRLKGAKPVDVPLTYEI